MEIEKPNIPLRLVALLLSLQSVQWYKSRCDGQMSRRRGETKHLYARQAHLARRGVWGAWRWAWRGANPSNRHWHCRSLQAGSSCQKQPVNQPPPSGNRSSVKIQSQWRIPVRSQQVKTTMEHLAMPQFIYIYTTGSKRSPTRTRSSRLWPVSSPGFRQVTAWRPGALFSNRRTGHPLTRPGGWLTTAVILLERYSTCYPFFSCLLALPASCVCKDHPPWTHANTLT